MDGNLASVSAGELYAHLGTASAPMLVDVRRQDAFDASSKSLKGGVIDNLFTNKSSNRVSVASNGPKH